MNESKNGIGPLKIGAGPRLDLASKLGEWETAIAEGLLDHLDHLEPPLGFAIVGSPGCGKTGVLHALASSLKGKAKFLRALDFPNAPALMEAVQNGGPWVLLDDLDKVEPEMAAQSLILLGDGLETQSLFDRNTISKRGRLSRTARTSERRLIFAADLRPLTGALDVHLAKGHSPESLLRRLANQRYYIPTAKPVDARATFWPEDSTASAGPLRESLRAFAERFNTADLRKTRQEIASLRWFATRYTANAVSKVFGVAKSDSPKEVLVAWVATTLLCLTRERHPGTYLEWYERRAEFRTVVDVVSSLESSLAREQHGRLPSLEKGTALWKEVERLDHQGFQCMASELTGGGFLGFYRDWRRQVLDAAEDLGLSLDASTPRPNWDSLESFFQLDDIREWFTQLSQAIFEQ